MAIETMNKFGVASQDDGLCFIVPVPRTISKPDPRARRRKHGAMMLPCADQTHLRTTDKPSTLSSIC